jgi:hypothetical protein
MPVDPNHIHTDQAHASTIDTGRPYSCKNRPPVAPFVAEFQDGWTEDGRRKMVKRRVEFKAGVDCGHHGLSGLNRDSDPKCRGCRWSSLK